MIIAPTNIPKYFHSMTFPYPLYPEKGEAVVRMATKTQLLSLCKNGCVSGIGSWKVMRKIRLTQTRDHIDRLGLAYHPIAEDNNTCIAVSIEGGRMYEFHTGRSNAYNPAYR
jgi:hypothetical protein